MTNDLTTAAGYAAWRDAGGLWPDETPERMRVYRDAMVVAALNEMGDK